MNWDGWWITSTGATIEIFSNKIVAAMEGGRKVPTNPRIVFEDGSIIGYGKLMKRLDGTFSWDQIEQRLNRSND